MWYIVVHAVDVIVVGGDGAGRFGRVVVLGDLCLEVDGARALVAGLAGPRRAVGGGRRQAAGAGVLWREHLHVVQRRHRRQGGRRRLSVSGVLLLLLLLMLLLVWLMAVLQVALLGIKE